MTDELKFIAGLFAWAGALMLFIIGAVPMFIRLWEISCAFWGVKW